MGAAGIAIGLNILPLNLQSDILGRNTVFNHRYTTMTYECINIEQTTILIEEEKAVIIDTRDSVSFQSGHIEWELHRVGKAALKTI